MYKLGFILYLHFPVKLVFFYDNRAHALRFLPADVTEITTVTAR